MTVQEYIDKIHKRYITGISREHSYRGDLQNLLESMAPDVTVTNEPARVTCSAPDYVITRKNIPVGYIEAKDIGADTLQKIASRSESKSNGRGKDLFIKVKAAYDLQRLSDLQNILLFLDDSNKEKLTLISCDEKAERIKHLENQVISLKLKIDQLKQSFPFSIGELILDEDYIVRKQDELRIQIKTSEEEIIKYSNIINIMANE